jgi:hypothetical protein
MELGTRTTQNFGYEHPDTRRPNCRLTRDLGLKSRATPAAVTFAAATGRVTGANGDFSNFSVGQPIVIHGSVSNDGERRVTGIDGVNGAYLVLDYPPKDEAGSAGVEIRTV